MGRGGDGGRKGWRREGVETEVGRGRGGKGWRREGVETEVGRGRDGGGNG